MAPHSSTLAWKISWMEKPGRLQSMGSLRVGHDWATSLSLFTFVHWRRKWQPTPVFLPGESQGRGAWQAAVYRVAQSQTQLKQLSSSKAIEISNLLILFAFNNLKNSCLGYNSCKFMHFVSSLHLKMLAFGIWTLSLSEYRNLFLADCIL